VKEDVNVISYKCLEGDIWKCEADMYLRSGNETSKPKCTQCEPYYSLREDDTLCILEHCHTWTQCAAEDDGCSPTCLKCEEGYVFNTKDEAGNFHAGERQCVLQERFKNCKVIKERLVQQAEELFCEECESGFGMVKTSIVDTEGAQREVEACARFSIPNCVTLFAKVEQSISLKEVPQCKTCQAGWSVAANKEFCEMANCGVYAHGVCQSCVETHRFNKDHSRCVLKSEFSYCKVIQSDGENCEECEEGHGIFSDTSKANKKRCAEKKIAKCVDTEEVSNTAAFPICNQCEALYEQ
jgi:hypothetical protein